MARQMKDSGVEWIGEIPDTWSLSRVGSYISLVESGVSVNAGINPAGEGELGVLKTSCVSTGKFNPDENKAVNKDEVGRVGCPVRAGCLIVSRMNTPELVGACGYVEQSYPNIYLPDRLWQIHVNPGYSAKFAYYYLTSSLARSFYASIAVGTSSSMQNISQKEFSSMRCTCPPYVEQERIAIFLDTKCAAIDKVVEQTRVTIEEYKKLKQAIITEAVTKGVRGPRPMKPSGVEWIGDIPEEWLSHKLKYVSSIKSGDYVDAQELSSDGMYPVYGGGEQISSYHSYNVNEETIIIGRVGARCGCVTLTKQKCWATDNALILSTNMYTRFAYYLLTGANLNTLNTSNAQPLITGTKIMNLVISNPCKDEQLEIAAYLDTKCAEIDRIIEKKEQLIEELGSYKKSLIYECVTGKREIKMHNYSQIAIH